MGYRHCFWAIALLACSDSTPFVTLTLSSELQIPEETDAVSVQIFDVNGTNLASGLYKLGSEGRSDWPQTVPLVPKNTDAEEVDIRVEAQQSGATPDAPSIGVGLGQTRAALPTEGRAELSLQISRFCEDADNDGFGVGFGCSALDCDDTDPRIPDSDPCPGFDPSDGGPGGPDAGTPPVACGEGTCAANVFCISGVCQTACNEDDRSSCPDAHAACADTGGGTFACACRRPCAEDACSNNLRCVDGCCQN